MKSKKTEIRDGIEGKIRAECKQWIPIDNFRVCGKEGRYMRPSCRSCEKELARKDYYKNREARREQTNENGLKKIYQNQII